MPSNNTAIVVLLLCLLASLGACLGVYFTNVACGWGLGTWVGSDCPKDEEMTPPPPSGTPGPSGTPAPINLQTAELTLSSANPDIAATTQPTVSATSNVVFTISMDINVVAPSENWREIFQNTRDDSWNGAAQAPVTTGNTPLVSIFPSTTGGEVNKVLFRMLLDNDTGFEVRTTTALVPGTYAKFTAVCNDTKVTLYINGTKSGEGTVPAGRIMKWRAANNFTWNPTGQYWAAGATVKVKNGKWSNRALTDAEVTALGTSTYMPQPLTMGTSAYVKETYMAY